MTDTVTVTKGAQTYTESNSNFAVPMVTGENAVVVTVSNANGSTAYNFNITKVESDYRGRTIIPNSEITVTTEYGGTPQNMFDSDASTFWSPSVVPTNETEVKPATSFIIDLGHTRFVSRIVADFGGTGYALWTNMARISTSVDGVNWEVPIEKGNMREDQVNVRYEFGKSYEARYIKYEFKNFAASTCQINELTIYEDQDGGFATYPAPEGADRQTPLTNGNIARGQEIVINKGFPISGWMPSEGYGRGTPDENESHIFGWDGPLFYDPELQNETYMLNNPNSLWGIAKAPWGANGMGAAGEPTDFVPKEMKPYIKNAVNFCYGDEGLYSTSEAEIFKSWFDWSKDNYPETIVHSNQAAGRGWEGHFSEYMQIANPDMLSFDDYYYHQDANLYRVGYTCLNTTLWKQQREAALKGIDGTGTKPIIFGQYLDIFHFDQGMSKKNLIVNLSMLTGMKWLNHFRMEYQFDGNYLWDLDGTPTQGVYEWGEVNRYLKTVDDYILLLNNDWVTTVAGTHLENNTATANPVATGWHMNGFGENLSKNSEYGITAVTAVNGNIATNNGLPGDVYLGYFNALPGLSSTQIEAQFGCNAPKAFMLLNGLVAGTSGSWNNSNILGKEQGSTENTKQTITVTVNNVNGSSLKRVNRDTGVVEDVTVVNNQFTVTLGGGEAELYFWSTNSPATATSETIDNSAAFAFDNYPDTYWMASTSDVPAEISTTFGLKDVEKLVINEAGENITSYEIKYLTAADVWESLEIGTTIGDTLSITLDEKIQAKGIKLVINSATSAPAIREIRCYGEAAADTTERVITVNDNVLGTAINTFSYDDKWSYRENENNAGLSGLQNSDVHFSNLANAVATMNFYGTGIELVFRNNNANGAFTISVDGGTAEAFNTTGTGGTTISKVISGLAQGVHTVVITKTTAAQAGIDCAKITYTGTIPNSEAGAISSTYINHTALTLSSAATTASDRATDEAAKANAGWTQCVQDANSNSGYYTTSVADAWYEASFYGTDLTIYGGEFTDLIYENINNTSGNKNLPLPVAKIHCSDENAEHTVRVKIISGRNRVDYVVASAKYEAPQGVAGGYTVTISTGENGAVTGTNSISVAANDDAVFTVTPADGYMVDMVTSNLDALQTVVTDEGKLLVYNVTQNTEVNVSFREAPVIPEPEYTLGDVNDDGTIDASDAILVLQYYAGIIDDNYTGFIKAAADINEDALIDANDAIIILQIYAGIS